MWQRFRGRCGNGKRASSRVQQLSRVPRVQQLLCFVARGLSDALLRPMQHVAKMVQKVFRKRQLRRRRWRDIVWDGSPVEAVPELLLGCELQLPLPNEAPHFGRDGLALVTKGHHRPRALPIREHLRIEVVSRTSFFVPLSDAELADLFPGRTHGALDGDGLAREGCGDGAAENHAEQYLVASN